VSLWEGQTRSRSQRAPTTTWGLEWGPWGGGGILGAVADLRARAGAGDQPGVDAYSPRMKRRSWTPHAQRRPPTPKVPDLSLYQLWLGLGRGQGYHVLLTGGRAVSWPRVM
jgi:hypothetical protein